jgi:hypothetical protein
MFFLCETVSWPVWLQIELEAGAKRTVAEKKFEKRENRNQRVGTIAK